MFWRSPTGRSAHGNWPKCNATLRGEVVDMKKLIGEAKTNKWLHVFEIKQRGKNEFIPTDPEGCWMPFKIQQFVLVPEESSL